MQLSSFEWLIITAVGGTLFAIVGYFLKRTMSKTDEHDKSIHTLIKDSVTKKEIEKHGTDINHIKQTYVTKDEMREMRSELRAEIKQLTATVNEIRDNNLPKEDYYRGHMETNRKLEQLQQLILDHYGGE